MDGKGIKIKFEADESPIRSALVRVEKSVKSISKELKEVDKLLELDPDNITLLTQKNEQLSEAITRTTKNLQALESANGDITKGYQKWQQNRQAIEENAIAIDKMTDQLEAAKTEMNSVWSGVGDGSATKEEFEAAAANVANLTKSLEDLKKEQEKIKASDSQAIPEDVYRKYIRDVESLRINLNQLEQQQTDVTSAIQAGGLAAQRAAEEEQRSAAAEAERTRAAEEAARAAEEQARADEDRKKAVEQAAAADKRAKQAASDYKDALNKLENAADKVKSDISGMATAVVAGTAAIGGAVAAGTAAVTKVGMGFTKSMSNVQALSGATGAELEALKNAASEAGANTSKTASEAADALGYMALAGWDTNQMLEGLMPVLRASEAGAMDLATCSDLVTDSMSSMGIAVGDLQHYLDVCSKTQASANTSMEQLLQAYVGCGGMLKNLNVPMEESAALLGTLANRGIKGAEAGTSLNAILVNLIGANRNAASAMSEMGISAFDASGRFIGLEETFKLVKSKLDEYGDDTEKISQLEAKLGGKTQLDTLMALLSGVSEEYDTLNGKINDCDGALEATAKTMQDNLTGDITSLQSALEGVENTIFDSLEEPFRSAAQNATKELRGLNAACSEGELADSLKKIAAAAGEMLSKMASFAANDAFPALINWLEWIADHSDGIISAITGMGVGFGTWKLGQVILHLDKFRISLVETVAKQQALTAAQAEQAAAAAAETAVINANSAAQTANTATETANTAAQAANTATTTSNTAATAAETTAVGANTAAQTANTAVTVSNTAATVADTTVEGANTTATAANTTAQAANTAAQAAGTAATVANTTATAAGAVGLKAYKTAILGSKAATLGFIAVILAATVALGKFIAAKFDAAAEEVLHKNDLDETTQALYDQAAAYESNVRAAKESYNAADEAAAKTKEWWAKVKELADEDGRAKDSTVKLQAAVDELNKASGLNIQIVDGQIQGYSELCSTMDDIIEKNRRQAKMSALEGSYGEALLNIDDVTERYNAAYAERMSAYDNYIKKKTRLESEELWGDSYSKKLAQAEFDLAEERFNAANVQYSSLLSLKDSYNSVISEYEDLALPDVSSNSKSKEEAIKEAAAIDGERIAELNRKNAELAKMGVKQSYDDLMASIDDLNNDLATHDVDDNTYWAKRKELLEASRYEEDAEWWKLYDETIEHYDKLAETEKKAQEDAAKEQKETLEKSIEDQINAVKERQETENDYTKEMMFNDMETIISGLDKESDVYKKYNSEILKGRKELDDEIAKQTAESSKAQIDSVSKSVSEIQSKYSEMLKDVQSEQEAYKNKLLGMAQLYSSETKTDDKGNETKIFTLENIDAQIKAIEDYDNKLKSLEKRGAGKGLTSYIEGLSQEDADKVMHVLGSMTDAELKSYSDKYDKLIDTVNTRAADRYAPQIEEINNGFVSEIRAAFGELPEELEKLGLDAINGFVDGFTGDNSKLIEAVMEKCNSVIDGFKNGLDIHSPSKETESLGEYTGEGFEEGLLKFSGAAAAEQFTDEFIAKITEKDKTLHDLLYNVFAGNTANAVAEMNAKASEALNNLTSSLALPDITQVSVPKLSASAHDTSVSLSNDANDNGQVVSLLQNIMEYLSVIYSILSSGAGNRNTSLLESIAVTLRSIQNNSNKSGGSSDIDKLIRGINKPLEIYLDRDKVGRAVMEYEHMHQYRTGT